MLLWAIAIEATNNRHLLETGASMFTEGDLAYVRAVRDEAETTHGPAFTLLPYFWQLMMRAMTNELSPARREARDCVTAQSHMSRMFTTRSSYRLDSTKNQSVSFWPMDCKLADATA